MARTGLNWPPDPRTSRRLLPGAIVVIGLALAGALLLRHARDDAPATLPTPEAAAPASAAHPLKSAQLERSVAEMHERTQANPADASAWAMLAHSQDMLGRHADATPAYEKLVALRPNDAQVLVDAADSLALARGHRLQGEPMALVKRALALDANNLKALSLAGTEAFDRKDLAAAIAYWERARAQVTDAALVQEIDANLIAARTMQLRAASGAGDHVTGQIVLAERLKAGVAPGDTLFVFARPADGSRMPVALMRRRAGELPLEFKLDDSMAMVPGARLSLQNRVIVGARISKRGDAAPQAGDLQGLSAPVAVGTQGLKVEISELIK